MVTLIAAISKNNIIGANGGLPFNCPEDMAHFKRTTTGNVCIFGRKTYEGLPPKFRPLPNRINIVITRGNNKFEDGVLVFNDLQRAIAHCQKNFPNKEIFICGGAEIYKQSIPFVDRILISRINVTANGDVEFPDIDWNDFTLTNTHAGDSMVLETYTRIV